MTHLTHTHNLPAGHWSESVWLRVGRPWHTPWQQTAPGPQTPASWEHSNPANTERSSGAVEHTEGSTASLDLFSKRRMIMTMNYSLGPVTIVNTCRGQVMRDALSVSLVIRAAAGVVRAVGGHLTRALGLGGHQVTCWTSLRVPTRGLTTLTSAAPHQSRRTDLVRNLRSKHTVISPHPRWTYDICKTSLDIPI